MICIHPGVDSHEGDRDLGHAFASSVFMALGYRWISVPCQYLVGECR